MNLAICRLTQGRRFIVGSCAVDVAAVHDMSGRVLAVLNVLACHPDLWSKNDACEDSAVGIGNLSALELLY